MIDPVLQPLNGQAMGQAMDTSWTRIKEAATTLQQKLSSVNEELAAARRNLDLAAQSFDLILQQISQGVLFIELNGRISTINRAAEQLLSAKNARGNIFWNLFSDELLGFSLREALTFGLSHKLLYFTLNARELEISTLFVSERNAGFIVLLKDITETQRLKKNINQQERMKELGEMAAKVVHEIRNPLGPIRGYASLLVRDLSESPHLQEMAHSILEGAKMLEIAVSAILQAARPVQLVFQSMELGMFLRQLAKFIRVDPAFPPQVRLEMHIPQNPLLVPIDPNALKSCLLNLIYNAFQAMPEGGLLQISLLKGEKECQIIVSDTGIGMSEEHREQIFSPFFTTKNKGTGLGLVEVKKILSAHGGRIEVRSQPKRGATFTLYLPLMRNS